MKHTIKIIKASGVLELYSRNKLIHSLQQSGADVKAIEFVVQEVESKLFEGISSKTIYDLSFSILRKRALGIAARYKLKKAMMEMGPSGYPFEKFVGEIFRLQGFGVAVGQVLQGHCVTHEVDVIATKGMEQHFIECKYYLRNGKNANVQVPLYIRSRVDDLIKERSMQPEYAGYTFFGGIVTNTRFSTDAISFGECTGLQLLSWDYPEGKGLKDIIDQEQIFPLTVLTNLTISEKKMLMDIGIVICSQLLEYPEALEKIGMVIKKQNKVIREVRSLCPKA